MRRLKITNSEDTPASESKRRRVFLVEDHTVVRQGIAVLINQQDDLEVCGEACGGPEAVQAIQASRPDVAVVDITLEHGNGIELIRDLRAVAPEVQILVMTMHDERLYGERSLRAGASGYIMKAEAIEKVVHAIRIVLEGKLYVSSAMADRILSQKMGRQEEDVRDPIQRLTDRELEIFRSIGAWKSTREIAGALNLSIKTVEYYREQIKKKLGLKSAVDLGKAATSWVKEGTLEMTEQA
jgi:DNA-binding NarL/FixJ family response regulator